MFILRSSNAELTKYEYNKGKSKIVVSNRQIKREYFCFCWLPDACCYFLYHKILCVPWGQAFVLQLYLSVCLYLQFSFPITIFFCTVCVCDWCGLVGVCVFAQMAYRMLRCGNLTHERTWSVMATHLQMTIPFPFQLRRCFYMYLCVVASSE